MEQGIKTYREMVAAIIIQVIVYSAAGAFISRQYVMFPVSVVIGGAVALGVLGNSSRCIDISLDLDPDTAKKYGRRQSVVRNCNDGTDFMCVIIFQGLC